MAVHVWKGRAGTGRLRIGPRALGTSASLASIWVAVVCGSIFAPDLVTGSNHDHIQIAAFVAWPIGAIASGMVLMAAASARPGIDSGAWIVFGCSVAAVWLAVLLTMAFAPAMVTGTDSTEIPIAPILAPIFGVLATAFSSIYIAAHGAGQDG